MIRFFAVFLIAFHLCIALSGCTSSSSSDDELSGVAPIEDDAGDISSDTASADNGDATADDGLSDSDFADDSSDAATSDKATAKDQNASTQTASKDDDDLESEFDSEPDNGTDNSTASTDDELDDSSLDDGSVAQAPKGEDELEDELSDSDLEETPVAKDQPVQEAPAATDQSAASPAAPAPAPEKAEKAQVRDIRYMANANGGTVVIETSQPVAYQSRLNAATQQFVIEMSNVNLPDSLKRPYLTKDFKSRIGSINAYQTPGSDTARVVIQLNGHVDSEPVVQQEGTSLVVVPPSAPVVAEEPPPSSTPTAKSTAVSKPEEGQALGARTLNEFLTGNQKFYGRKISLQVKDADIRDVVNFLAEESGANIVMSDDVKGNISLKLRRVPWDQALVTVMRTKDLGYVRQGNVLRISTLKQLQDETDATNKILQAQKAIVPDVVQVIPVNYANLDELVKNLAPFLSKEGKVVADSRTNTLIVTDKAEVVNRAERLIHTLDIPPAQVSIESKIVEAVEEFENFMGINWGFGGSDVTLSSGGGAHGAPISLNLAANSSGLSPDLQGTGPFTTNLSIGTLDVFGDLTASLMLAEKDSLAKVISSPRISAMNREKSTIEQKGENVAVITTTSQTSPPTITKTEKRTPFSLELSVTPQITIDGSVIMELDVKREFLGPVVDQETGSRAVNTRSAHTKVLVHNGQTAVIGGIYTSDEAELSNGVPGLMNIPVLGWLFKNKSISRSKNELLIFLTPRILAQDDSLGPKTASAQ